MVNPIKRLRGVEKLIDKKLYFTIHAPRQSGKTTFLYALAQKLNEEGKYLGGFIRTGRGLARFINKGNIWCLLKGSKMLDL